MKHFSISRTLWRLVLAALLMWMPGGARLAHAQTDTTAFRPVFVTPPLQAVINSLPVVRGTAQDNAGGSGVNRVTLAIFRIADQQWWNGTAFTPTFTELATTLSGNTWERTTGLPNGADLPEGQYTLIALGYDNAGNRDQTDNVVVVDKTAPNAATFTQPTNNQLVGSLPTITGTVQDNTGGSGIATVTLLLRRDSDGRFWSGTDWVVGQTELATRFGGGFFTRDTELPSGASLQNGTYSLTAIARDLAGNRTDTTIPVRVLVDNTGPTVTYTFPRQDSVVNSLPRVKGSVVDNTGGSGVNRVTVAILRIADQQWWNGSAFTPTFTELTTTLTGSTWERNSGLPNGADLPEGQYVVAAIAYDNVGNRTQADNVITVDKTAPASLAFTQPTNNQLIGRFTSITGTVQDNTGGSGIDNVVLFIKRSSDGRWWSGTDWVEQQAELQAQTGGGFFTRNSGLPSGAFLQNGTYFVTAVALDVAGNRRVATISVRVLIDASGPAITYTSPTNNAALRTLDSIRGTLIDNAGGAGAERFEFGLLRVADNRWWNGSEWVADFVSLTTQLSGRNFSRTTGLPTGANLRDGGYVIVGSAFDRVGNRRGSDINFSIDTTAPATVTFTRPLGGARISDLTPLSGTATDTAGGSGIARVLVQIKRSSDGRYWSGRNWSISQIALPADLGANNTWTRAGGPAGINLRQDTYFLTAIAFDRTGNRRSSTISVRVVDTTPPVIAITSPAPNALQGTFPTVTGTITDAPGGTGPARVLVSIRRLSDGFYWNGSTFVRESATIPAALTGNGTTWALTQNLPRGANLRSDNYAVIAIGFDGAGNRSEARVSFPVIPDTVAPTFTVDTPRAGSTIQRLTRVAGTIRDNEGGSGIDRVGVAILRARDELWWNGSTWTDTFTTLPAVVSGNTYALTSSLPSSEDTPRGFYTIIVQAFDRIGNQRQIDRNIAIDSNGPVQTNAAVTVSSASADAATGTVRVTFASAVSASAIDDVQVTVDGAAVAIESVDYNAATHTATFVAADEIPVGAAVSVSGPNFKVNVTAR